ncbi:hypothetical protein RchiOBHm_Chr4g0407181 [Rosa chinensis]|uniref:Uncharacterized protein n=1 Tax=Rosa chinensis TaxID=74649 RepID=A0A2P6QUH8_ROSCH|nr:hypothetical protein RchiOBHm_Chr4g0407181 [Rosa chinensis]
MLKICLGFLLACSHSDDHLLSNRRLPNWKSGIPLPIFSEWWLFSDKFSAIDSFVLSSFPGAMFQGMNGLSVKYQVLDLVLGHGDDLFRLAQSKALVSIHDHEAGKGGELTHDNDYNGALDLTEKTAKEAMKPIE